MIISIICTILIFLNLILTFKLRIELRRVLQKEGKQQEQEPESTDINSILNARLLDIQKQRYSVNYRR